MICRNLSPIRMSFLCRVCCDTDIGSTEPWAQPVAGAACCGRPFADLRVVRSEWHVWMAPA